MLHMLSPICCPHAKRDIETAFAVSYMLHLLSPISSGFAARALSRPFLANRLRQDMHRDECVLAYQEFY